MSLNLLTSNRLKPWLNARVNNLTVDGTITHEGQEKKLFFSNEKTGHTVSETEETLFQHIFTGLSGQTYRLKMNFTATVNWRSADIKNCVAYFKVLDNSDDTVLHTGKDFKVTGVVGNYSSLTVMDHFNLDGNVSGVKIQLLCETTGTGGERAIFQSAGVQVESVEPA